jgi:hypothetical protein
MYPRVLMVVAGRRVYVHIDCASDKSNFHWWSFGACSKQGLSVVEAVLWARLTCCFMNLQIRRFTRYVLGEGIEKKSQDFAAEVAAQTGQEL